MAQTLNYNRDKDPKINVTPMEFSVEGAEVGGAEVALAAGTGPGLQGTIICDADDSVGTDLQDWALIKAEPVLNADGTTARIKITVTPILGDGSTGTPVVTYIPHEEDMDAWQAAAGRAQQA